MRFRLGVIALALGAVALAFVPLVAVTTLAGPDASVRMSDAPGTVSLSSRDLTDLGFGGEVPTSDWLLPGVCRKASGGGLLAAAGEGGAVEDIGSPTQTWSAGDAAPEGCGASSTSARVHRLPPVSADPGAGGRPPEAAAVVAVERTDRARLVRAVLGGVEGEEGVRAAVEVVVAFSDGFSWDNVVRAGRAKVVDAFVPAGQALTITAAVAAAGGGAGTAGVFIAGVSVTEIGEAAEPDEAEPGEAGLDAAGPDAAEPGEAGLDAAGSGEAEPGGGAGVAAEVVPSEEPGAGPASAPSPTAPVAASDAGFGLAAADGVPVCSPRSGDTWRGAAPSARPAGWSSGQDLVVEKQGWVDVDWADPLCASPSVPSPAVGVDPSPPATPVLAGVPPDSIPAGVLACLGTGTSVAAGAGPVPVGKNITWVYTVRDNANFGGNYFPVNIRVWDSELGLVCSANNVNLGGTDSFTRGVYCIAVKNAPVIGP